jgi:hypothetical protein
VASGATTMSSDDGAGPAEGLTPPSAVATTLFAPPPTPA